MNQQLFFVLFLLAPLVLTIGIYLLVTHPQRRATKHFNLLCNTVWQVNASLRTREWDSEHMQSSLASSRGFELMQRLTALVEECNQHRDVAKAWLLAGRIGYATVRSRCDLGLAAVGRFHRNLRRYDKALAEF